MKITPSNKTSRKGFAAFLVLLLVVVGSIAVWMWVAPPETPATSPAGRANALMTNLPSYR